MASLVFAAVAKRPKESTLCVSKLNAVKASSDESSRSHAAEFMQKGSNDYVHCPCIADTQGLAGQPLHFRNNVLQAVGTSNSPLRPTCATKLLGATVTLRALQTG